MQHGKDYRFRNENNTFYSRQSCCDLTLEETVKELLDELSQTEQSLENFSNKEYELYENVEQLKKENADLKSAQNKVAIEKLEELYKELCEEICDTYQYDDTQKK